MAPRWCIRGTSYATSVPRAALPSPRAAGIPAPALVVGLAAAAFGYLLHHIPALDGHAVLDLMGVVVVGGVAAFAILAISRSDTGAAAPVIVVSSDAGGQTQPLARAQLPLYAAMHTEALPHGFFVSLGPRFLRGYLTTFVDSPHAVALSVSVEGQPVGFLVGVVRPAAHTRWVLRRHGVRLALWGASALLVRPRLGVRFVRTRVRRYAVAWRRHRGDATAPAPSTAPRNPPAVLSHIVVVPGARGTGAGRTLVHAFEEEARDAAARWATLLTQTGSEGAGGFYESLGWTRRTERSTPDGERVEEWTKDLETAKPCADS